MANITNRRHAGDTSLSNTYTVLSDKPLDDRSVVRTVNELFDLNTWRIQPDGVAEPKDTHYAGMPCAVVADSTNNGLYLLVKKNKYNKQSWDKNADNYDPDGWMKINGVAQTDVHMDTSTENEESYPGSFGGNGTEENPYYVSTINGGVI